MRRTDFRSSWLTDDEHNMNAPKPSHLAYVPFVSVENMMKLVHHLGIEPMLRGIAGYVEEDFRRWELFDKTPRVASHSRDGVIELMPTSDGEVYGDGIRPAGDCRYRLSGPLVRNDGSDGAAHGRDLGHGRAAPRPEESKNHGHDRQRRAVRVSGACDARALRR